ncbi:hypothetical protein [Vibrio breoganii]|uniref:hypothetical protein n=1 Tax=Vibrio breoganii TaxID=553239 RepID=UPI001056B4FD|nr:hypothetical protein [Vibrio breoganii]
MKTISSFGGEALIAGRLSGRDTFTNLHNHAESYQAFISKLDGVNLQKLSSADKQAVYTKMNGRFDAIGNEMRKTGEKLLNAQITAKQTFDMARKPSSEDMALIPLMANKTTQQLLESAYQSPEIARVLSGPAGTAIGLDKDTIDGLGQYAAPQAYSALKEIEGDLDTLIKLKGSLDQARVSETARLQPSEAQSKVNDALSD